MRLRLTVAVLCLVFGTCAFAPPEGIERFTPPLHYRQIWEDAEKCSGKTGDFNKVHWYVVPGRSFRADGVDAIGHWHTPHDIAIASEWLTTDWVVRHEMVHELTRLPHDNGPRDIQIWGRQCHAMWGWLASDDPGYRP